MTTKDYNIKTYAGGPDCNPITYRIKNIEGLPPLVWCKDPMFSYTAEDKYPWHATSLHNCIVELLYADIYNEEYETLKKYSVKNSYTIRSTEYHTTKVMYDIPWLLHREVKASRIRVTPSCSNDAISCSLKAKPSMIESYIERKYKI